MPCSPGPLPTIKVGRGSQKPPSNRRSYPPRPAPLRLGPQGWKDPPCPLALCQDRPLFCLPRYKIQCAAALSVWSEKQGHLIGLLCSDELHTRRIFVRALAVTLENQTLDRPAVFTDDHGVEWPFHSQFFWGSLRQSNDSSGVFSPSGTIL